MKNYLQNKIHALLSLGIRENQPVLEARQVKTLNQISFFLGSINAFLLIVNIISQRFIPLYLNIAIVFLISAPIFFLNFKLKYKTAQIYSFFASNTLILLYACFGILNNRIVNFEILILGCGFFGAFIFNTSWMLISLLYNLSSYIFIGVMKVYFLGVSIDSIFIGSMINCFATSIFLYAIITIYKRDFRLAELALSKSEDRLNLVLKGSNDGWWDWDLIANTIYYSPRWWNTLGYEYNELPAVVELWWSILHPDDHTHVNDLYNKAMATDMTGYEVEFRLMHKTGHYVPVLSKGFISRDDNGKAIRISGSNIDLTERNKQQQELESLVNNITEKNNELSRQKSEIQIQSEKLTELNEVKDKLFSIIAHDIRSPITSLLLTLNSVTDEVMTAEELLESLPDITKNAKNILDLIDSLFGWARSQLGGAKIYPNIFNVNKVIEEEISLFSSRAKEKKIELISNVKENFNAFADKDMIELVIRNLISNAIKFCKNGDKVEINISRDDYFIEISVLDTGNGISPEGLEKIFTTGVVSTKGTSDEIGTGLGLMLSKEFVEKNGGMMGVLSELRKGSRFFFTVPIAKQEI
jgi:PAS domain S-box-containing protein